MHFKENKVTRKLIFFDVSVEKINITKYVAENA